jgi:hypothetical protein
VAMLETYALMHRRMAQHGFAPDLVALLHQSEDVGQAQHQLHAMLHDAVRDAALAGQVRTDVPTEELVAFSLHALHAAGALRSEDAVERLVRLTMAGMRGG